MRGGRAGMPSSMGRLNTGAVPGGGADMARPMTAVRAAGYTSAGNRGRFQYSYWYLKVKIMVDVYCLNKIKLVSYSWLLDHKTFRVKRFFRFPIC